MEIKQVTEALAKKYNVDMEVFMELYKRKLTREVIAEKLEISQFIIRKIGDKLNLVWKKSGRADSYIKYQTELKADSQNSDDAIESQTKEIEYLQHKLKVSTAATQRSRDEANFLRSTVRKEVRDDSLEDKVLDLVEQALPIKRKSTIKVTVGEPSRNYEKYVSAMILSDLHVEESVIKADVGLSNVYNWDVVDDRIGRMFVAWFNQYRGETRGTIFILGDVITGVIHDALESTTKPTAEAVHDLADMLSDYIATAAEIFQFVDIHFVSGNHERLTDRIKSTSKGLDFGYLFAQILKAKLSGEVNVVMNISTTGYISTDINGKVIGGMHGDLHRGPVHTEARTFKVYEAFKNVLGIEVDHIIQGHTHIFGYHNTHKGAYIVNGSLIGSNAYGVTNGFLALRPSQTLIQFDPYGEVECVRQIFVDEKM